MAYSPNVYFRWLMIIRNCRRIGIIQWIILSNANWNLENNSKCMPMIQDGICSCSQWILFFCFRQADMILQSSVERGCFLHSVFLRNGFAERMVFPQCRELAECCCLREDASVYKIDRQRTEKPREEYRAEINVSTVYQHAPHTAKTNRGGSVFFACFQSWNL